MLSQNARNDALGQFVYRSKYLEDPRAVEIDPVELKLSKRTYETVRLNGAFGALRDAGPDYWGRRVIEKNAGKAQLGELDYLLESPDDRAGALGFGLNTEPPAPKRQFNQTIDLEKLQALADALVRDDLPNAPQAQQVQDLMLLGTSMGGAIVDSGKFDWSKGGKFPSLAGPEPAYHGLNFHETFGDMAYTFHSHAVGLRDLGPSQAPFNAWLTMLGMETLGLRVERHCANARKVADALAANPRISRVLYPGRPDHPQHKLAASQMSNFGGVVTFDVKGGKNACFEALNRLKIVDISNNLGDAKSMVTHPATTTHMRIGAAERAKLGIGEGTVRISVGLEDVQDIIEDLTQALG